MWYVTVSLTTNVTTQGKEWLTQHMNPWFHRIYIYNAPQPKCWLSIIWTDLDRFRQKRSKFSWKNVKIIEKFDNFWLFIFKYFREQIPYFAPSNRILRYQFWPDVYYIYYLIQPYFYIGVSNTRRNSLLLHRTVFRWSWNVSQEDYKG